MIYTVFVCPCCGMRMTLPRNSGQKREKNHVKDIYCIRCRMIQKFAEYRDNELAAL